MDSGYQYFKGWNYDYWNTALNNEVYWQKLQSEPGNIKSPLLLFFRTQDWTVSPYYLKNVKFLHMLIWKSEVEHLPFQENKPDLEQAILRF